MSRYRIEVESHGIDHAQYFRGSSAEDSIAYGLGIGDSEREAFDNACEQIETSNDEIDALLLAERAGCSDVNEIAALRAEEARPREYRVTYHAHNGAGTLHDETHDTIGEALANIQARIDKLRKRGNDVSRIGAEGDPTAEEIAEEFATVSYGETVQAYSWESEEPDNVAMIGPDAGILSLEILAGDADDDEYGSESELYYYLTVRIFDDGEEG